jgi:hypothetical protein
MRHSGPALGFGGKVGLCLPDLPGRITKTGSRRKSVDPFELEKTRTEHDAGPRRKSVDPFELEKTRTIASIVNDFSVFLSDFAVWPYAQRCGLPQQSAHW